MGLESSVTQISDLNSAWPLGSDDEKYGDDHVRFAKVALKSLLSATDFAGTYHNGMSQVGFPGTIVGGAGKALVVNGGETAFVLSALNIYLKSIQTFTATGTWTRPTGITRVLVVCIGGGAGGSGGSTGLYSGGGGGGGCRAEKLVDVSSIATATVTIGAGGTGGATGTVGGDGGDTSFVTAGPTTQCLAKRGIGGSAYPDGGLGGLRVQCTGDVTFAGGDGTTGEQNTLGVSGGNGGGAAGSRGGGAAQAAQANTGGGGGGGGMTPSAAGTGGAGGSGYCIVYEYGS